MFQHPVQQWNASVCEIHSAKDYFLQLIWPGTKLTLLITKPGIIYRNTIYWSNLHAYEQLCVTMALNTGLHLQSLLFDFLLMSQVTQMHRS